MTNPNPYDELPYPNWPCPDTYPERLRPQGILRGMQPAPAGRCRLLELGCGTGINLVTMGLAWPESEFVGIDLAADAIVEGTATITSSGVANVRLLQGDVCAVPDLGQFDYIVAHGLFSWIPLEARHAVLAICQRDLADHGIAYISYTVYPGAYQRRMIRDMLLYHVRDCTTVAERLERARHLLTFFAAGSPRPERFRQIVQEELNMLDRYGPGYYRHDLLADLNHPMYFHEFIEDARRYRLQFLTDLNQSSDIDPRHPPEAMQELRRLAGGQPLECEQYADFFDCQTFRQTLLCHADVALDPQINPLRVLSLSAQCSSRPVSANPNFRSPAVEKFQGKGEISIETGHPLAKAAVGILAEQYPRPVPFVDLLAQARCRLEAPTGALAIESDPGAMELAVFLIGTDRVGFARLVADVPNWATTVNERPSASPQVRWQARTGQPLTNIWGHQFKLDDPFARHLLTLLDGTRDLAALVEQMAAFLQAQGLFLRQGDVPIHDPPQVSQLLLKELPATLLRFARLYLLVD